ncbi:NlpC/P60 family protein [Cellulosilyticum ruminicola]|uniref:NlpC/P60 family protein n=1 Tax=Cellulosilyticum ruminicola TaxID=425254 RepID=UPI0006D208CE|nr:NlpC/P60 family protein [Cellulosilyticum ruminicola]
MKFNKLVAIGILMATMVGNVQAEVVNSASVVAEIEGTFTVTTDEETKLRETASPTGDIIKFLNKDVTVQVLEKYGDFYKVAASGVQGYIYKTQLDTTELQAVKEAVIVKEKVANASKGEAIVALAKKYIGGKYVYGGTNLETGVDCSGFTQQIMKKNGITIERTSRSQYAANGVKVSVSNIKLGDLVFYGKNGVTVDHVAIYAGDNKIVHASDSKSGIKMSNLYYGKPIIGVKRVIN